jgi:DNA-3-methyladenine glycosylase II
VICFPYGDTEMNYLKRRDRRLGQAIDDIGVIKRKMTPDPFTALVRTIIGQQISTKAAQTVCARVYELVGNPIDPPILADVGLGAIQGCGMSERKAGYILGAANATLRGEIDFDTLLAVMTPVQQRHIHEIACRCLECLITSWPLG